MTDKEILPRLSPEYDERANAYYLCVSAELAQKTGDNRNYCTCCAVGSRRSLFTRSAVAHATQGVENTQDVLPESCRSTVPASATVRS